jgi:glycyl-tRNA synthetase alpha chain
MEIMQYTYMQKMGGIECQSTACEITYGLERVAMYVQNKENIFDINWGNNIKYSDIHKKDYEIEQSEYLQNYQEDTGALQAEFLRLNNNVALLIEKNLIIVAYEQCLKASHLLNILDARQAISYNQRLEYILLIRENVARCCTRWLLKYNN